MSVNLSNLSIPPQVVENLGAALPCCAAVGIGFIVWSQRDRIKKLSFGILSVEFAPR